jgi:hypothetical protein
VSGAGTISLQGRTGPESACTNVGTGTTTCSLRSPTPSATFVPTPAAGSVLTGWGTTACFSLTPTCTVEVASANGRISATFQAQGPPVISIAGDPASTGGGRVTGTGIDCTLSSSGTSGLCSDSVVAGSSRTYTARPFALTQFVSWGGLCAGQSGLTCTLASVTASGTVAARFDLIPPQVLTIEGGATATGTGTVTSSPAGAPSPLSCTLTSGVGTGTCSASYGYETSVVLTPAPAPGSAFNGWSGACSGFEVPCEVRMNGPQTVRAFFVPTTTLALGFAASSNSDGTLTSSNGLSCSGNFEEFAGNGCAPTGGSVPTSQPVTVTPSAPSGAAFVGWTGGPCTGQFTQSCTYFSTGPTTLTARFGTQRTVSVEVEQQGNANQATWDARLRVETIRDTVVISVPPIPLVVTGPYTLYVGDQVRFTATPGPGGAFGGWVGDCASFGSNPVCTLTVTANTAQVRAVYFPSGGRCAPIRRRRRRRRWSAASRG